MADRRSAVSTKRSRRLARRRRAESKLTPRQLRLEQFEARLVMAASPVLVSIIPNTGEVLLNNQVRDEAPRELTFRFDEGQIIDASTLSGIVIKRGGDGILNNANDVVVTPGFLGIGDRPNEVVARFADPLPDDVYQITIIGAGSRALENTEGDAFNNGTNLVRRFELDLAPQVVAVVPQPVTRGSNGALTQRRNVIEVYLNNDNLDVASATDVNFYQLIYTNNTADTSDDVVYRPTSVSYNATLDKVTLTFASDLAALGSGAGNFRLRIGDAYDGYRAPITTVVGPEGNNTDNTTIGKATDLGTIGVRTQIVQGMIEAQTFPLQLPGSNDEPGHRDVPAEDHLLGGADGLSGPSVITYSFPTSLGSLTSGQNLPNVITAEQRQRVREVFEFYSHYLGVQFVEVTGTAGAAGMSQFRVGTGDLRAVSPTVPTGPGGVSGIAGGGLAVMDNAEPFGRSEFGGFYFNTAMHEIGHLLGLGHSYDLPSIQGSSLPGESVFPGDHDLTHGQHLYRPDSKDIDTYKFKVASSGTFIAELVAERQRANGLPSSLLDGMISIYDSAGNLVARNDDYYSEDSYLRINLTAGTYYAVVTSTGNDDFNLNVNDSGFGGTTAGAYDLRLTFEATQTNGIQDADGAATLLDGDADGKPGGQYNYWFKVASAANTVFVDKMSTAASPTGSIGSPYTTISAAFASAQPGQVVRIIGNGGIDRDVATLGDNVAYEVGFDRLGRVLADGRSMQVPRGVSVMIDAGAIFKLRNANVDVGSLAQGIDLSGASLQVLGTPTQSVYFTSYDNETIGRDTFSNRTNPSAGDWGGIVFRNDLDVAAGRQVLEDQGIFLNYINHANISYGGGQVVVNSVAQSFSAIHMAQARPTVAFNRLTDNAGAAMSGDPDSFKESRFGNRTFQADYGRVGPSIYRNQLIDNAVNGLFIRIDTLPGNVLDRLDVAGRFDDTDIVHVLSENLIIRGTPGGHRLVNGVLEAQLDASLVIDAGVVVKLQGARIETEFGSQLIAEGDARNRVIFTSQLDDRYGGSGSFDTGGDGNVAPAEGNWGGLYFGHLSSGSLDNAVVTYAGGTTSVEGGFASFNAIEVHQAEVRITNSVIERNANGRQDVGSRGNRLSNGDATVFVRGAQPIIVGNIIRDNAAAAISINANALNSVMMVDWGRSTGRSNSHEDLLGNAGPLVRLNRIGGNGINGMVVRGETLSTDSVWDDTDIVHVLTNEIIVGNHHSFSGLTLKSSRTESLVVKLAGANAGFTATGTPLDINDRIGGSVYIVGQPGRPVVLTALADDTVGAGLDDDLLPQTDTDGNGASTGTAGAWRSIRLDRYSNDRNVALINELEDSIFRGADTNSTTRNAQLLGLLAPDEKSGDDNRRLGFEVHGYLNRQTPGDVDVYGFQATAGTEVWIDLDRTRHSMDAIVDLIDANGNIVARSINSRDETTAGSVAFKTTGVNAQTLDRSNFEQDDLYSTNPRDPGMRVVLPGTDGRTATYYVRVRSNGGRSSGEYELQVRLRQIDEFAGSTVSYADIRFATNGVEVLGLPANSPLTGESAERPADAGNEGSGGAVNVGNLLESNRNTISVSGSLSSSADVDWYQFNIDYDLIQAAAGVGDGGKTWATIFDIDWADGISRPNTTISVFDAQGRLILVGRDSDVSDDQTGAQNGQQESDLTRGSFGELDPQIGNVQMPAGTPGSTTTYYVAISSDVQLPTALTANYGTGATTNAAVRLEPINTIRRIAEDHIGFSGYTTGDARFSGFEVVPATPTLLGIANAVQLNTHVRSFTLSDVPLFLTGGNNIRIMDPSTGDFEVAPYGGFDLVRDLTIRSDGRMFGIRALPGDANNVAQLVEIDPTTGGIISAQADGVANADAAGNPPSNVTSDTPDALTFVRIGTAAYDLYYTVRDGNGQSRLIRANQAGVAYPNEGRPAINAGTVGDVGFTTGITNIGGQLYGVSDQGQFFRLSTGGTATILGDYSGQYSFTGLTRGPQNLDFDGNGTGGDLADVLFATTSSGELVALRASGIGAGQLVPVFDEDGDGVLETELSGVGGAVGLAFSPVDFNLWHPTMHRSGDVGHGVNNTFDNSRVGNFERIINGRDSFETSGGASFYFGLEQYTNGDDGYFRYGTNAQYGNLVSSLQEDLSANNAIRNTYNIAGGAHGSLVTNAFSLKGYTASDKPTLYFNYFLDTQNAAGGNMHDSARVFVSRDGGNSWELVATNNRSNVELPGTQTVSSNTGSGDPDQQVQELFDSTGAWRQARIDLGEFADEDNLLMRFDFDTAGRFPGSAIGFGTPSEVADVANNQFEGFYIDDIIVGFAERGELVTGAQTGDTSYAELPRNTGFGAPSQVLTGRYQLEIRRGTETGRVINDIRDSIINIPFLDTNDRLVEGYSISAPEYYSNNIIRTNVATTTQTFTFSGVPSSTGSGRLRITINGDFDQDNEFITVNGESVIVNRVFTSPGVRGEAVTYEFQFTAAQMATLTADGAVTFTVTKSAAVDRIYEIEAELEFAAIPIDGKTFVINDGLRTVTFEFDNNGTTANGNVAVAYTGDETGNQLAQLMVAAINGHASLLTTAYVDGPSNRVHLIDAVNVVAPSLTSNGQTGGNGGQLTAEPNDTIGTSVDSDLTSMRRGQYQRIGRLGNVGDITTRDVDMVRFQLNAGDTIVIKAARTPGSSVDPVLRVFNSAGAQVAFDDDDDQNQNPDVGQHSLDSYLIFTATTTGTYYLGVSGFSNTGYNPNTANSGTAGSAGEYQLTMSMLDGAAPEFILDTFDNLGDQNQERQQGYTAIHNNTITDASGWGIVVNAEGQRSLDLPSPGAVRNTILPNDQRLVPGVSIFNNLLAFNAGGGIDLSGDQNDSGEPQGATLFARVTNNTIHGGPTAAGTGIRVRNNSSPTLLNNIFSNLQTGIFVDASNSSAVVGASLYKGNAVNTAGVGTGSFAIPLGANDPLFINAAARNFYLAASSRAIDSSINSLDDRPSMTAVTDPLGIPPSPILAPEYDLLGQLRVNDPAVASPNAPGLGSDVFKDRGAIDRSDFDGPTAVLLSPRDNDGSDENPARDSVFLRDQAVTEFSLQLVDGVVPADPAFGVGINDATASQSSRYTLFRNGVRLREGVDYNFSYDPNNDIVRFVPVQGVWPDRSVYTIVVANTIRDLAGNALKANRTDGTTQFNINLGALDYGDAPSQYPVLLSQNGARHLQSSSVFLGAGVTGEGDGQPSVSAEADQDDGVVFRDVVRAGQTVRVTVTASTGGTLNAWLDFNGDGDWSDAGEQIFVNRRLSAGTNNLTFTVPASFDVDDTYARFRFSSQQNLSFTGEASDGEVEDYKAPTSVWQNPANRFDVNNDQRVNGQDLLAVLNSIEDRGERFLGETNNSSPLRYYDVNGDGALDIIDAVQIVNYLNGQTASASSSRSYAFAGDDKAWMFGREITNDSTSVATATEAKPTTTTSTSRQVAQSPASHAVDRAIESLFDADDVTDRTIGTFGTTTGGSEQYDDSQNAIYQQSALAESYGVSKLDDAADELAESLFGELTLSSKKKKSGVVTTG